MNFDLFVQKIKINRTDDFHNSYISKIALFKTLDEFEFKNKITVFVGENGTGKSTLLEAVAIACGLNPEGGSKNFNFETFNSHSLLANYISLSRGIKRPKDSYFLRAESFYNVASNIEELDKQMASSPPIKNSYGGKSLHEQSHGESFLSLVVNRLGGNGLYILDEPEAALSPSRQMTLLSQIYSLAESNSQFIIATHSPIIMAIPGAAVYEIKDSKVEITKFDKT